MVSADIMKIMNEYISAVKELRSLQYKINIEEIEDSGAEAEWSEELERRAREVLGGSVKTVPWEQVEARIGVRFGQGR